MKFKILDIFSSEIYQSEITNYDSEIISKWTNLKAFVNLLKIHWYRKDTRGPADSPGVGEILTMNTFIMARTSLRVKLSQAIAPALLVGIVFS